MGESLTKRALSSFWRRRSSKYATYILGLLYILAIGADFIAPYRYDSTNRLKPYHHPTRIHFFKEGNFVGPYVYNYHLEFTPTGAYTYVALKTNIYKLKFFTKGEEYKFLGIKSNWHLFGVEAPANIYLLGSDSLGRDIFSRLLHGARISLSIGLFAVTIAFFIGMFIGGIAGYFGGIIDSLIMRIVEVIICFPEFYLLLALRAAFPPNLPSPLVYLLLICIMSLIGWAGLARIIRGFVLSLREKEYILHARTLGAPPWYIIIRHALPNTLSYALVSAFLTIPTYILGEAALSMLGLGITEPYPSWGNMLQAAFFITDLTNYPWILAPGVVIFITICLYNIIGDNLRRAFDPYYG